MFYGCYASEWDDAQENGEYHCCYGISDIWVIGCTSSGSVNIPKTLSVPIEFKSKIKDFNGLKIPWGPDPSRPLKYETVPVIGISSSAFANNKTLQSITIPDGVTTIRLDAFDFCTNLRSVVFPANAQFKSVDGIYFGGGYLHIEDGEVDVEAPPTSLRESGKLFAGCEKLEELTLPKQFCKSPIGNIFEGHLWEINGAEMRPASKGNLKKITIPDGVNELPHSFFNGCTNLTSVTLPSTIKNIGNLAFYRCAKLSDVTIPSTVTNIGTSAFSGCAAMKSVFVPDGVKELKDSSFKGCSSLATVSGCKNIVRIGDEAFSQCGKLANVAVSGKVVDVGAKAFSGCSSLARYPLTSVVTNIGNSAFMDCSSLEEITWSQWPRTLKAIPTALFKGCSKLKSVRGMTSSIGNIGASAFEGCENLSSILLPGSVTNMDAKVFQSCTHLTSVQLPSYLKTIPDYTFNGCASLTSVTMPSYPTSIGKAAFFGCNQLTSLRMPVTVQRFGDYAFGCCWKLRSISLPEGTRDVPERLCWDCRELVDLYLPSSITNISSASFYYCLKLQKVTIPGNVQRIKSYAFYECGSLATVAFKDRQNGIAIEENAMPPKAKATVLPIAGKEFLGWLEYPFSGWDVYEDELVEDFLHSPISPVYPAWRTPVGTKPWTQTKKAKLQGVVYQGDMVLGIAQIDVGKPTRKGQVKVGGSIAFIDGRTSRLKATTVDLPANTPIDTGALQVKGEDDALTLTIGDDGFTGKMGEMKLRTTKVGGDWTRSDASVCVEFYSEFPEEVFDELIPCGEPVIPKNGKWSCEKAANISWKKDKATGEFHLAGDDDPRRPNLAALKLNYSPRTGVFKGSFKLYALQNNRLKKYGVKVNGVVVNGQGFGMAILKKPFVLFGDVTVE